MAQYVQVSTAVETREEAECLARELVESRLAGCVQIIGPMTSVYRWQGKVEQGEEFLCLVKTRADGYPAVEEAIRRLHSYEVPEIIACPIAEGSEAYLRWLDEAAGSV